MLSTMAASLPTVSSSGPGASGSGAGSSTRAPRRPFPFTCSSRLIARSASIRLLLTAPRADLPHLPRPGLRLRQIGDGQVELDGSEPLVLHGPYYLKPDQLEERKEGHDDLPAPALRREDVRKLDPRPQGEPGQDALDALGHRQPGRHDGVRWGGAQAGQHITQRVEQIGQAGVA